MSEKSPVKSPENRVDNSTERKRENKEHRERLRKEVERKAERSKVERPIEESAERRKAERLAEDTGKKDKQKPSTETSRERRSIPSTKHERQQAYDNIMDEARSQMSPAQRSFSKLIHNPAVETASNAVGATVARPNAILAGSFTAFVVVLGVFLIARYYGYPLSGSETIVAFVGGWALGLVFDYLRTMITGRH